MLSPAAVSDRIAGGVEDYFKLLLAFRALPERKRSRTFMEISGYPHYENVSSNILAFFFDPAEEHGLGDLLLAAFFQMAGLSEPTISGAVQIQREHRTDESKRLDLLIDGESFTLGIENKIYHWLANDLQIYSRVIDRHGQGKATVVKAVLGLRPETSASVEAAGFQSYTYTQLWQHVRARLGHHLATASPKWVNYLLDFMETTQNLAGQNLELQKTDQFFIEHHELLERLTEDRNAFFNRLYQKVATLEQSVKELPEAASLGRPPRIWNQGCLVLEFPNAITFDLNVGTVGWELTLFGRNHQASAQLAALASRPPLAEMLANSQVANGRYIAQVWPLHAGLDEIEQALALWMRAVRAGIESSSI